jgi:serine/threonine protein phosphatase 1
MISLPFSPRPSSTRHPRVPNGVRVYAIGDIHGRADLLDQVFKRIDADFAQAPLPHRIEVFLGDYVDRGPASRQILELLIERGRPHPIERGRTHQTIFLKGNHESLLVNFPVNPSTLGSWQRLGGLETLMSYGLAPSGKADPRTQAELAVAFDKALPPSHRRFLNDLRTSLRVAIISLFTQVSDPASRWTNRAKKTCSGFGRNFCFAKRISVK